MDNNSAETARLLEQIRAGDQAALNEIFARHRPRLRRMVELRSIAGYTRGSTHPMSSMRLTSTPSPGWTNTCASRTTPCSCGCG